MRKHDNNMTFEAHSFAFHKQMCDCNSLSFYDIKANR